MKKSKERPLIYEGFILVEDNGFRHGYHGEMNSFAILDSQAGIRYDTAMQ